MKEQLNSHAVARHGPMTSVDGIEVEAQTTSIQRSLTNCAATSIIMRRCRTLHLRGWYASNLTYFV